MFQAKIDEEMAKLRVDVGVYLPSNPDGVVVDIDKKSGRPLQSHAKVCTFRCDKYCNLCRSVGSVHGHFQSSQG